MKVLTRGEVTEMMSLAVTAAQCMNKVAISREIREFTHKGKDDGRVKEKVSPRHTRLCCCGPPMGQEGGP